MTKVSLENGTMGSSLPSEEKATCGPSDTAGEKAAEEVSQLSMTPTPETAGGSAAPPPVGGEPRATGDGHLGWFRRHRVMAAVLAGLVTFALLGGMFALGYAVGKPDGERPAPAGPVHGRPWTETGPNHPYPRLRERGEIPRERVDLLRSSRRELLEVAASELGISVEDLEERLEEGASIAEVAEEKGVSAEDLVDSLASRIREIADRLASEGKINESRAEAVKSRAEALASLFVHGGLQGLRGPLRE